MQKKLLKRKKMKTMLGGNIKSEKSKSVCLFHFQCPITDICKNGDCFWKQRDCYGRSPWYNHENPDGDFNTFGEMKFPTITGYTGTNEIGVWCEDAIIDGWDGGTYKIGDRTEKLKKSIYCNLPDIKKEGNIDEIL